jgi:hypothetical protein
MKGRNYKFEDERHQRPDDGGARGADRGVFGSSGRKVGSDTTDKRRGRGLARRLDKLDRDLAERRAVVGATGEPVVENAVSAVPMFKGSRPKLKQCCLCLAPAQYSLAFVISTLGIKRRLQKCSPVVLLCDLCIRKLCRTLAVALPELQDSLKTAYTAIASQCPQLSTPTAS